MNFLTASGIVIFIVWAYILFIRPQLALRFPAFYAKLDKVEATLWASSRQILLSRLYWVGGAIVGIHDYFTQSGADPSTMLGELANFIPEAYRGLALSGFLLFTGLMFEWLRRVTTGPVGSSAEPK